MSGDCRICGQALVWSGMSWIKHDERDHAVRRRILLGLAARQLKRLTDVKELEEDADRTECVLIRWRNGVYKRNLGGHRAPEESWLVPFDLWDGLDCEGMYRMLRAMRIANSEKYHERYRVEVNPATWFHVIYDGRNKRADR